MQKIFFFIALLLFMVKSFSQTKPTPDFSKDYYLQKAKSKKTTAWVLLGGGIGLGVVGIIVQSAHENERAGGWNLDFTGAGIAVGGGVLALSSIPFFISSANNKKKAALITMTNQHILVPQQNYFALKKQRAITLKIPLY